MIKPNGDQILKYINSDTIRRLKNIAYCISIRGLRFIINYLNKFVNVARQIAWGKRVS